MDAQQMTVAERRLDAACDKTMAFPGIVATPIKAGFEGCTVDYRRNTTTYFLADGNRATLENRPSKGAGAARFEQPGIAPQMKWAQANPPECSDAAFCANVKAIGCAGYVVSFLGKRVLYVGWTTETHVEHFPQQLGIGLRTRDDQIEIMSM